MTEKSMRIAGIALAVLWAAWWIFFIVASESSEPVSLADKLKVCAIGVSIVVGCTLPMLLHAKIGGALLLLVGLGLGVASFAFTQNPPATRVFLFFTLALPPILSGVLSIAAGLRPHPEAI